MRSQPKLLVLELWGLGDLVIASPFLRAASSKFSITLLAKPYAEDLRKRLWPEVRVVSFSAPWTAFRHKYRLFRWPWRRLAQLRHLAGERFDIGLSARWDPRDHLLLCVLRARRRLGFARAGSGLFLTESLRHPGPHVHGYENWRVLAEKLGLELPSRSEVVSPNGQHKGEVLLHTGAGQPVRVWPLDRYRELVQHLRRRGYRVQVAADANQQTWWTASGENDVATPRTVNDLLELIGRASAFIGNDSGPGHLAAFLGVPTFTLFGPQLPARFAPLHPAAEWLEGKPCAHKPCLDNCCCAAPGCLWDLGTEEVFSRVESFLGHHHNALILEVPAKPRLLSYRTRRPRRFIQVFCRYLKRGGEEVSVARIARHLEWGGHKVIRFWRASEEWIGATRPHFWNQAALGWNNAVVLGQLRELHRRFEPDAWLFHNIIPVVSLRAYRLARELGVPVLRWIHNHRPISPSGTMYAGGQMLQPDDPWLAWKEIWHGTWHGRLGTAGVALAYARLRQRGDFDCVKAWIAISEAMRRTFLRAGYPPDRLFCLHHSWDIDPPIDLHLDQGYFLFLGRMVEEKGIRFLVDLWQRPEFKNIQLVMAGEGDLADKYRARNFPNIRWTGFVQGSDKRRLIAGCRAMLFPCLAPEALGLVVYEAYEQAKPVLASPLGGLNDVVLEGKTGRLLTAGDASAWCQAILQYARDPEMARQQGRSGLEWLQSTASPDSWNRRFDDIIEQALDPVIAGRRREPSLAATM